MAKAWKRRAFVLLATALGICRVPAYAQSAAGLVEGRITCNDGGTPARGASVQLISLASLLSQASGSASPPDSLTTTSDFSGQYSLLPVEPGTYIVNAALDGYADNLKLLLTTLKLHTPEQLKSMLAAFPQITVKAGGDIRQDLVLRRAGAIFGKVSVDTGGPLSRSLVTATLVPDETTGGSADDVAASETDDRGDYRISGLPAGSYRVSVQAAENFFNPKFEPPKKMQRLGFADLIVFAPEALAQSDAKLLKVTDGDEFGNVDITIPVRLLHSLAGTVTRGSSPVAGITLSLEAPGNRVLRTGAVSMVDGSFRFDLLPDGEYTLLAKTYTAGKAIRSTRVSIQLSGSDTVDLIINVATSAAKQ